MGTLFGSHINLDLIFILLERHLSIDGAVADGAELILFPVHTLYLSTCVSAGSV